MQSSKASFFNDFAIAAGSELRTVFLAVLAGKFLVNGCKCPAFLCGFAGLIIRIHLDFYSKLRILYDATTTDKEQIMFAIRYKEIVAILRQRIVDGTYVQRLPSLRSLCSEFMVCKSTMSKVLNKLAYAGLVRITHRGTIIMDSETTDLQPGMVAIITSKLDVSAKHGDEQFIGTLKRELAQLGFGSAELELDSADWSKPGFWQRLNFDGYIFIYSSFYLLPGERASFSTKPRIIGNYLPDEIGEYCVDFDDAAGLQGIIQQLIAQDFSRIALAITIKGTRCGEAYFDAWSKLMRNFKLHNYNNSIDDFSYSPQLAERWCTMAEPPEIVICANTRQQIVRQDMQRCTKQVYFYQLGEDTQAYINLAKTLAHTFAAVYSGKTNVPKHKFIGRYAKLDTEKFLSLH